MVTRRNDISSMVRQEPFEYRAQYNADHTPLYEGWALPGTATSASEWIICKHTHTSTDLTQTSWANGGAFSAVWDNRSTYFS